MSLVSSGLSRFFPFAQQDRRCQAAEAASQHVVDADVIDESEIAAVEFADAFAQFNLDVCHRRSFLQAHQQQKGMRSQMAQLSFARNSASAMRIDEHATIAFAEEATASTSAYEEEKISAPVHKNSIGGLKRTVSSLHFNGGSLAAIAGATASVSSATSSRSSSIASSPGAYQIPLNSPFCWHGNQQNGSTCLVQANQIEMEFLSMSGTPFELVIHAPSGERSSRIAFCCGRTAMFAPRRPGCGHGNWRFEIRVTDPTNAKKTVKKTEQVLFFDGVGTLFFCIDANLNLTLTSQQFLRLPSHNRCCNATLKHSVTQPTLSS